MDYWLDIWCRLFRIEILRVIHDFAPHPGEFWPTRRAINRRAKIATKLFVFSGYVYENLRQSTDKEIYKCSLPDEIPHTGEVSADLVEKIQQMEGPIVLFLGRIKKYKGLDFFLATLEKYPELECSILIAGCGSLDFKGRKNVHFWNHWLSEAEIRYLLTESTIVVFPYMEASQSGVIPLAMKSNKTILATKVGSLEEQLMGYKNKVLVEPGDQDGLMKGLDASIRMSATSIQPAEKSAVIQSYSLGNQIINALDNFPKRVNHG
jgi:glycosyltransferase involved in cell wall biosynthesis